MKFNEEKIDRRAHWAYFIVAAIVLITAQWIRMESRVNSLEANMIDQKKSRDQDIAQLWNRFGSDHDQITKLRQWVQDHRGNLAE